MKKAYIKPQVYFEDFQLSASIAAGCEVIIKNPSQGTCGYVMTEGVTVFTGNVSGCSMPIEDGSSTANGLCYHVPFQTYNLFTSA